MQASLQVGHQPAGLLQALAVAGQSGAADALLQGQLQRLLVRQLPLGEETGCYPSPGVSHSELDERIAVGGLRRDVSPVLPGVLWHVRTDLRAH